MASPVDALEAFSPPWGTTSQGAFFDAFAGGVVAGGVVAGGVVAGGVVAGGVVAGGVVAGGVVTGGVVAGGVVAGGMFVGGVFTGGVVAGGVVAGGVVPATDVSSSSELMACQAKAPPTPRAPSSTMTPMAMPMVYGYFRLVVRDVEENL